MFNWLGIETKMISFLRGSLILEIHLFRGKIYLRRLGRRIVLSEDDFYWPGKMIGDWKFTLPFLLDNLTAFEMCFVCPVLFIWGTKT
ncbi:hypothetical protein ZWY2020_020262 [Hordeum vulgare]|nr:hypothetical protein ZWY2020_020262 [Hordeum vulgare]